MASIVSRESYANASDKLTAGTRTASAQQLATVADEVLSVAGLLRAEPRLRRALTDPSREPADRTGLLRGLLSGKLSQATVDAIEGGIRRAEAAQAEANQLLEQYRAQLAEARTEAARIRDEARADAEGIRQDLLAKAREESDRIIAAGRDQLAAQRESIVRDLRAEVGSLAVDLASRIVGESLADEARRRGTVERFIAELDSAGAARGRR